MAQSENTSIFTHSLYDKLKFVAQIILPALATLCLTIGGIWELAYTNQVAATITAVDLFLGGVLKLSSRAYYRSGANFDGDVNVIKDPETGENKIQFAFDKPPADVVDDPGKHSLEYKINRVNEAAGS